MNENGMIRQYLAFAVVVFIALFVVAQIEWGETPIRDFINNSDNVRSNDSSVVKSPEKDLSFADLRTGSVTGFKRRQTSRTPFSPPSTGFETVAASSSPFAATSTAFQNGSNARGSYSGVSIEFTKPPEKPLQRPRPVRTAKAVPDSAAAEMPEKPGNSPADVISDIEIRGHVVDDRGEPITGLALTLKLRQASTEDKASFGTLSLNTQSNDQGVYSFVNLVEGEYQVCTVESKGFKSSCQNPRAPHSSADFSLRNVLGGRVYGTVKDEHGEPLSEVTISATPGQRNRTVSDSKGQFSLKMIVNADLSYQLHFTRENYARERVPAKGRDILAEKRLDIVLEKTRNSGFDVTGTLYDQSGAPVSGRTVTLTSPSIKSATALRAASDPNGEFTIKYVQAADDYRLRVNTGGGYTFDAASYARMKLFEGVSPLSIQLQSNGSGSFSAHVVSSNGAAIKGETFSLYSGSAYVGRSVSDIGGEIRFDKVPVKEGGSALRISGGSTPKYTFSGMNLAEGEHKSAIQLLVDRGENNLVLTVKDESKTPLQGVQGLLIWTRTEQGVRSQTVRSRGKISMAGTGIINFSELGQGEHQLQLRLKGYKPYSASIDITQQIQYEEAVLSKIKE